MTVEELNKKPLYKQYGEHIHFEQWDVVMVDFGENVGSEINGVRPAVVVSTEIINRNSGNVIVAPLTKADNKKDEKGQLNLYGSQVFLSNKYFTGLSYPSIVMMENIRTISRNRVIKNMEILSEFKIDQCKDALAIALG